LLGEEEAMLNELRFDRRTARPRGAAAPEILQREIKASLAG
jgi:hypothetical protein